MNRHNKGKSNEYKDKKVEARIHGLIDKANDFHI